MANLDFHILEDDPPRDFCCGAEDQDDFLHRNAWQDQQRGFSNTFLSYKDGICVGFITISAESIEMPRHKWPIGARFGRYGASKILQMATDHRHDGRGYGSQILTFGVTHAVWISRRQATRYVIVDAVPAKVDWYIRRGFAVLDHVQKERRRDAKRRNRDPKSISVRLHLDLNEIPRDAELLAQIDAIFRP